MGGKTLEEVTFDNGDSDSIRAGSGVYLAIGIHHYRSADNLDLGIRAGYLFDLVTAKNTQGEESVLSFTRKPIDVFSHYHLNRHRLGGGLTVHLSPLFNSRETGHRAHYRHAFGGYLEYLYDFIGTGTSLGIKYTHINYHNTSSHKIASGSGVGIAFNQLF